MKKEQIIIITPVYNEEKYLDRLINAVVHQTVLPTLWIFINDHSTDNSIQIINKWMLNYDWIIQINAPKLSGNYGPKIVSVRRVAYQYVIDNKIAYDYLAHLDADIILPFDYYYKIVQSFKNDSKLGICGGILTNVTTGNKERSKAWWIRDGLRVYRKECLNQTGFQKVMWAHDSSDLLYAIYKEWNVLNIDSDALHLRPTGSKIKLKNCYSLGKDIRLFGYDIIPAFFKSYKYTKKRPYILGTFYFLAGYFRMIITSKPFYFEKDFRTFLNKFYLNNLH